MVFVVMNYINSILLAANVKSVFLLNRTISVLCLQKIPLLIFFFYVGTYGRVIHFSTGFKECTKFYTV